MIPSKPSSSATYRAVHRRLRGRILLQSCATQPIPTAAGPPGFLSGLLHGFLILFSFIASLFTDFRIYAFPNSGGWYDFGYLLGAMGFLGGGGAGARR